jgi:hypothetical protein
LWLTLDAGTFEGIELVRGAIVRVTLAGATPATPRARLRIERPAEPAEADAVSVGEVYSEERGAVVVPLGPGPTVVTVRVTR